MRHVPERPLDPLPSIKIKLSALIVGAVATTVFVFWFLLRILGLWPSVSGIAAAVVALVLVRFVAAWPHHPVARDGRGHARHGPGRLLPARHRHVTRRDRGPRPFVQPHGGGAGRDRPRASRSRRQREPRAAHPAHRAAGDAREHHRRRRHRGSRDAPHDAGPGRAARASGRAAPRPLPARGGHRPARPPRLRGRASARARGAGAEAPRTRGRDRDERGRARPRGGRRSRARPPGGGEPAGERGTPLARGRRGRGARRAAARRG